MPEPGDPAGDCIRCGAERIQIGYDSSVLGVYCERCELTEMIQGDAIDTSEGRRWDEWRNEDGE